MTGVQQSTRYCGALPCRRLCMMTPSLYVTWSATSSQCRSYVKLQSSLETSEYRLFTMGVFLHLCPPLNAYGRFRLQKNPGRVILWQKLQLTVPRLIFSSAGCSYKLVKMLSVFLCVWMWNHNDCTQRLVILCVQTYYWTLIAQQKRGYPDLFCWVFRSL